MEFLELFKDYLVLIVIGICMCVGYVLKNIIPSDKINKFIPLIMAVLGLIINLWVAGWHLTPEVLLGGLASGLASTGAYEAIKNLKESTAKNIIKYWVDKMGTAKENVEPHDLE
ncbi:MAG: phage holin family protein [Bacteroidales bacterium]|nr:phage holin family protein [Bacteroidales bacterium]